jgi:glycosyltransferase involved in cell wall biosynthesis
MKILYIVNVKIPAERAYSYQIAKTCESFAKMGLDLELIVPNIQTICDGDIFKFYGLSRVFKYTRVNVNCKFTRLFKSERLMGYCQSIIFILCVIFRYWNKKNTLFYTRSPIIGFLFTMRGCLTVFEAHGWKKKEKVWVYRAIIKKAHKIIANSEGTREVFIENGASEKRVLAVSNGVDLDKFDIAVSKNEARKKVGLPENKKIVLYSGSFFAYSWKGIDILLKAGEKLSKDILIVLVGGRKSEIQRIKDEWKFINVLLFEYQHIDLLPYFLKSADILILPNKKNDVISEKYTSPLKLVEYMASKRPIIASDLPSIRQIVDEESALLIQPENPELLAEAIQKILFFDKDKIERMVNKAYKDVLNYSWDKRAEKILKFIDFPIV